ncbi:MAG: hypothetical protein ACI4AK_05060, partial [Lepagella sp.]
FLLTRVRSRFQVLSDSNNIEHHFTLNIFLLNMFFFCAVEKSNFSCKNTIIFFIFANKKARNVNFFNAFL